MNTMDFTQDLEHEIEKDEFKAAPVERIECSLPVRCDDNVITLFAEQISKRLAERTLVFD